MLNLNICLYLRLGQLMDKFAQTVGFNPGDMGFVDTARNPGELFAL